ncbi:Rap guanine nucleotide exchange factor (GEF) 4 [Paragonimus heterotremus]|uniref:Rap guanine nucleotide exchange factor (GEF) 4 n=1 Tax=Paragonimus heterotremus TaxID=100268 RepID=A0A8J4X304_9TREM|nr:Rap guanine nucleotide exchange factor (GEF) 4 [Paragonimus heterotremus]
MFVRNTHPPPWITRACLFLWDQLYPNQHSSKSVNQNSGSELVTKLLEFSGKQDRMLAAGVWQVLLEESAIEPVRFPTTHEQNIVQHFQDSENHLYHCCCNLNKLNSPLKDSPSDSCSPMRKGLFRFSNIRNGNTQSFDLTEQPNTSTDFDDVSIKEDRFHLLVDRLYNMASDAVFRQILLKPSQHRTSDELSFIFQELLMVPSLAQFSRRVRMELSRCLHYEVHPKANQVLFHQGDPGTSWYIIHRGSVWVHVDGQGYVCRLSEGDDFGKLALVTGATRAASIVIAEDNSHFLRVEKQDFDRILSNVEANTVRLREGNSDVLILERIPDCSEKQESPNRTTDTGLSEMLEKPSGRFINYSIVAGTTEKILQHILEVRLGGWEKQLSLLIEYTTFPVNLCSNLLQDVDQLVEDFLLTFSMYTTPRTIFTCLCSYIRSGRINQTEVPFVTTDSTDSESTSVIQDISNADRVIVFLYLWYRCYGLPLFASLDGLEEFLRKLKHLLVLAEAADVQQRVIARLYKDCTSIWAIDVKLGCDYSLDKKSPSNNRAHSNSNNRAACSKKICSKNIQPSLLSSTRVKFRRLRTSDVMLPSPNKQIAISATPPTSPDYGFTSCYLARFQIEPCVLPLKPSIHLMTFPIYLDSGRKKYTITVPINCSVSDIKDQMATILSEGIQVNELQLVEVMSKGDKIVFDDTDRCVFLGLSLNSCLFLSSKEVIPSLSPLPVQLNMAMNYLEKTEAFTRGWTDSHSREYKTSSPRLSRTASINQSARILDEFTADEIASVLTHVVAQLAVCIGPQEFLDYTLGCAKTNNGCPHIRLLVTHFSLIHAWTITQILTTPSLNKRAQLVKKLIKLADRLITNPYFDQHTCFAVVLGLNSSPIARLTHTWDRVSVRWRRVLQNRLLPLIDPSRNHRAARGWLSTHDVTCVPFMALILKDLRFTEDANQTVYKHEGEHVKLVNFEKMRLLARNIRAWNKAMSGYENLHPQAFSLNGASVKVSMAGGSTQLTMSENSQCFGNFYEHCECIDDIRILTQLSLRLEPKKG